MKRLIPTIWLLLSIGVLSLLPETVRAQRSKRAPDPPPIRALLVTGGASHDYASRKEILVRGIRDRSQRQIEWMVRHQGSGEGDDRIPLFESEGWAEGYDLVLHDHCFPRVTDREYVDRVLKPHREGLPAVLIHGTMHSFRTGDDRWFEFCGVASRSHDRERELLVEPFSSASSVIGGMKPWAIPRGQLYRIDRIQAGATALTRSLDPGGEPHVNSWTHLYGPEKARVFGTTIGNETRTMLTPAYLDLVARGFLWAIGDLSSETFLVLPPDREIPELPFALPNPDLLEFGPNKARWGQATALSDGEGGVDAGKAIDGNALTYWEAATSGPCSWEVDLGEGMAVVGLAMTWRENAPSNYLVEGSDDGASWTALVSKGGEGAGGAQSLHLVGDATARHLRISFPETAPGFRPGLREFAVYRSEAEIPAALLQTLAGIVEKPAPLLTSAEDGIGRGIRLASGWSFQEVAEFAEGEHPIQIVPTASGRIFVLVAADGEPAGSRVVSLSAGSEGGGVRRDFLESLPEDAAIAWDGEWLYALWDGRLEGYRGSAESGPADERWRVGTVFSLSDGIGTTAPVFSQMQSGPDGWLYALVRSFDETMVRNSSGEPILLPRHGLVRFRRSGSDFQVHASSRVPLEGFRWGGDGEMALIGGVARSDQETEEGFLINPFPTVVGELPMRREAEATVPEVRVDGLRLAERVGEGIWIVVEHGGIHSLLFLKPDFAAERPPLVWDGVRAEELAGYLASADEVVRKEVAFELLRRKRNPVPDLLGVLGANPSPATANTALSALSAADGRRAFSVLVELARSKDSDLQRVAFRHLADRSDAKNHPVFGEISRTTEPQVTSAILYALLRTGTDLEGLGELAFDFASHPDPGLAKSARSFLGERRSTEICFAVLDDPAREKEWDLALDLLSRTHCVSVVEEIARRVERTGSPRFRQLAIGALARMHFLDEGGSSEWAGTPIIHRVLEAALSDRRVDRATLLKCMRAAGIPVSDLRPLLKLAKEEIAMEAVALEELLSYDGDLPEDTVDWLSEIASHENRDGDLRLRALGLLVRHSSSRDYRRRFEQTAKRESIPHFEATADLVLKEWLFRRDHAENVAWLIQQARGGNGEMGRLACKTLWDLSLGKDGGPDDVGPILPALSEIEERSASLGDRVRSARIDLLRMGFLGESDGGTNAVGQMTTEEIAGQLGAFDPDPLHGRSLFRHLSCVSCHNIHGEGPSHGPDLTQTIGAKTTASLVDAILRREGHGHGLNGYDTHLFERLDGIQFRCFVEGRADASIAARDRAGNRFEFDISEIHMEWDDIDALADCSAASSLAPSEFAALLSFLRSLASP